MTDRDRRLVTISAMLAMFLAALEATAVAAAVPTAIGKLGGVSRFGWVFSAYLLTSTTTVPLYGKLADLFGRKRVFEVAIGLFLLGSILSGAAANLPQLIAFRALQGLGAGGVVPVAGTIIADLYSLTERARLQGLFSAVWATASLLGPPLGGLITDFFSWRWIFYFCLPFGLASALILDRALKEQPAPGRKHDFDVLGTVALTVSVTLLLLALLEGGEAWGFTDLRTLGLFAGSALSLGVFLWQEGRAREPMLPLSLFRNRLISVASAGNVLIGTLIFAITAFVPMFGQGVMAKSATSAGALLTPMLLGWPISAFFAGRWLMRAGYRRLTLGGGLAVTVGAVLLWYGAAAVSMLQVQIATLLIGLGLGLLSIPCFLSVQSAVAYEQRGVATSSVQFFRTIGGAVAVAALGAVLNGHVRQAASAVGNANALLDPVLRAQVLPDQLIQAQGALASGIATVFAIVAVLAALTLAVALLFPRGLPVADPA